MNEPGTYSRASLVLVPSSMLGLDGATTPVGFCYDQSNRNSCITNYDDNGNGTEMFYSRDVNDRITYREHDTISDWSWNDDDEMYYGYTGSSNSPSFARDANGNIVEEYVGLPGGIMMTVHPQQTAQDAKFSYNLPNVEGNTLLTVDGNGSNTSDGGGLLSSYIYDPFGNPIGSSSPSNTSGGSYGYKGAFEKLSETMMQLSPIQMGARVYLPTLGRFTSMDPIPGGNANAYVYALDPINFSDISGMSSGCAILCISAAEFYGMQSSNGATNYLQSSVSAPRIIYSNSQTASIRYATSSSRAQAKPAYNNSTAIAAATVAPFITKTKPESPLASASTGSFVMPALGAPAGYSRGGAFSAIGQGCAYTGGSFVAAGMLAAPFTDGISIPAAAFSGCIKGAVGGALTYIVTGNSNVQDTSLAQDVYEFLMEAF